VPAPLSHYACIHVEGNCDLDDNTLERDEMFQLSNWIFIGSNAYDEYTYVPWLGKNVYRRTVDLRAITLL
jgi:hypothetical protein